MVDERITRRIPGQILERIRRELDRADRFEKACDPRTIDAISNSSSLLIFFNRFNVTAEFTELQDINEIIKKRFINNCICRKR